MAAFRWTGRTAFRNEAGVSLIELVVALVILGFALGAAVPSIAEWMRNLSVRNAGESIRSGLERARLEALRRNTPVTFWLVSDSAKVLSSGCAVSSSGPSWVVSINDPSGQCEAQPSSTEAPLLVDKWSAADGASNVQVEGLDGNGAAAPSATFNSLGQLVGAGQIERVNVSHTAAGARNLRVVVQPGGVVRLCDPNVAADDPRRC